MELTKYFCLLVFMSSVSVPRHSCEMPSKACGPTGVCKCFTRNFNTFVVNCSRRNLNDVPSNIPNNVTWLFLSSNNLTRISKSSFFNLTSLKRLELAHNNIDRLANGVFSWLKLLDTLVFSHNKLASIPKDIFAHTKMMKDLALSHNRLESIPEDTFKNMTRITVLDLSHNNIKNIPNNLFASNRLLKTLRLSANKLIYIPRGLFTKNGNLSSLELSRNNLENISEDTFVYNKRIKNLFLNQNGLTEIPNGLLEKISSLQFIDLSSNKLRLLPHTLFKSNAKLNKIYLTSNELEEIPEGVFENLSKLKAVDINENRLRSIPDRLFFSNSKLERLRLCSNNLHGLPERLFISINNLHHLSICNNILRSIDRTALNGSTNLRFLNLYGNQLSLLPANLFSEVNLDGVAFLSDNGIKEIHSGLFCSNKNCSHDLKSLFLHNNSLAYLQPNCFMGLRKLEHVFLNSNNIMALGEDVFAGTQIRYIYMFSNNLVTISNRTFDNDHIYEIQLYKNDISFISERVFVSRTTPLTVYLHCKNFSELPLFATNVTGICVKSELPPAINLSDMVKKSYAITGALRADGFNCSSNEKHPVCSPCPPGTYGDGHKGCRSCPVGGFYQDDFGRLDCKECPMGTYVNKCSGGTSLADCKLCPEGTNLKRKACHRACFCKMNHARNHRFEGCPLCLEEGLNCSEDYRSILPGYYWNWSFQDSNITEYSNFVLHLLNDSLIYTHSDEAYRLKIPKIHECPRKSSCANQDSSNPSEIEGSCRYGYRGWLCNTCQDKFYSVMNICFPCPGSVWVFLELLMLLCFCLAIWAIVRWQCIRRNDNEIDNQSFMFKFMSRLKIALGFYQVVGELFKSFYQINYLGLEHMQLVAELISVLEVSVFQILSNIHCSNEKLKINLKLYFIISLSLPVALFVSLMSFYCIYLLYIKYRLRHTGGHQFHRKKKICKETWISFSVILLYLTYSPICYSIFKMYPAACKTFYIYDNITSKNITLLRSEFDLDCTGLKAYHLAAYTATITHVATFPCVLYFLLRKYCKRSKSSELGIFDNEETSFRSSVTEHTRLIKGDTEYLVSPLWIKFLCVNYKPQFWYWEIMELFRKISQTILVILLGWEDALTKLFTIAASVLFITLHAKLSPMSNPFEQCLQMLSLTAIFINVLIASVPIRNEYQTPTSIFLIMLNMVLLIILTGEAILGGVRLLRNKFAKARVN